MRAHLVREPTDQWLHAGRPVRPTLRTTVLVILQIVLLPAALHSQILDGTLMDRTTGRPLAGAMAVLLDEGGAVAASTLTSQQGRFVLRATVPGRYRVRTERIGYRSETSAEITLAAGERRTIALAVAAQAISLEGVIARGDRRCRVRPQQGLATADVWEEARKALATTDWVQRERALRYELDLFDRVLEPERLRVIEEQVSTKAGYQTQPFVSVPLEALIERGFVHAVDGGAYYDYYAPDAAVLLSDAFLDTHCLRLVAGEGGRSDQVGLVFEPVPGREVPEIRGTFWLDERSALLRTLEYRYTNLPWSIPTGHVGGRVEFALLPSGALVVRRWRIRMPRLASTRLEWGDVGRREIRIQSYGERGGEVIRVQTAGGAVLEMAERAVLAGEVFDSTRSGPLAGARVSLVGTPYAARTDSDGRFRIPDLPEGIYDVSFSHPRLDSLPAGPPHPTEIDLRAGEVSSVSLSVPSLRRLLLEACPGMVAARVSDGSTPGAVAGDQLGLLHGLVRDSAGAPVPGAAVRLSWSRWDVDFQRRGGSGSSPGASRAHRTSRGTFTTVEEQPWSAEAVTDEQGRYLACDLPAGVPLRAIAWTADAASTEVEVRIGEEEALAAQDLELSERPTRDLASALLADPDSVQYRLPGVAVEVLSDESVRDRAEAAAGGMRIGPDQIAALRNHGATTIAGLLKRHQLGGLTVKPMLRQHQPAGVCVEGFRASQTRVSGCRMVALVLDGAVIVPAEAARMLESLPLDGVHTVEYLMPSAAFFRFGHAAEHGAIVVTTRH